MPDKPMSKDTPSTGTAWTKPRGKAETGQDGPPPRPHMTVTQKPEPSPHDVKKQRD
ncbi:hypothetical protein Mnod_5797 [Methylobacterium nodulans ORS 2060]|uniref:Uncharacterized protein n=1 Tax=Methylobacterium nodulans (strain LMG 21967 / CNCM I-2342 / ORS 2060) TaxID=460265 RepID=B8IRS6_METNO|nr:hypothetical protein Mnod_5797 [Methylobacterium nodulans ORS 2060]